LQDKKAKEQAKALKKKRLEAAVIEKLIHAEERAKRVKSSLCDTRKNGQTYSRVQPQSLETVLKGSMGKKQEDLFIKEFFRDWKTTIQDIEQTEMQFFIR